MKSMRRTNRKAEKGAALVEFALSVPVLFLFFSGVLEFGNILSQLTWVAQAGYHLAVVGAESPQSAAQGLIDTRLNQLKQAKDFERFGGRLQISNVVPAGSEFYNNDPAIRTVAIRLQARIVPISSVSFSIPVDVVVTAPQLVANTSYNPDYSRFGVPQPYYSNCAYLPAGGTPNASACLTNCPTPTALGSESCS